MKSDLKKTCSICQDWSPELLIDVCEHACAHMHTVHQTQHIVYCLFGNFKR